MLIAPLCGDYIMHTVSPEIGSSLDASACYRSTLSIVSVTGIRHARMTAWRSASRLALNWGARAASIRSMEPSFDLTYRDLATPEIFNSLRVLSGVESFAQCGSGMVALMSPSFWWAWTSVSYGTVSATTYGESVGGTYLVGPLKDAWGGTARFFDGLVQGSNSR